MNTSPKQDSLDKAIQILEKEPYIGIDTESSGFYTYFSELCLIQLSAGHNHFIIDPLVNLDLSALGDICANSKILKIFHSAISDIMELKRHLKWNFVNIFDTFLACRFLGHASCSLFSLVTEYENIELEKKEQKSNWKQRPLTSSQLEYAHLDTVYLGSLMIKLREKLERYNMYKEIEEEFSEICKVTVAPSPNNEINEEAWKRIPHLKDFSAEEQAMIRELYFLREKQARIDNIAPFRLLPNHAIVQLIKKRPSDIEKSRISNYFAPSFLEKNKTEIAKILTGKELDFSFLKIIKDKKRLIDSKEKSLLKKLKKWRLQVAEYRGIDTSIILTNQTLNKIVKSKPQNMSELSALEILSQWKINHYGKQILDIILDKYDGTLLEGLSRLEEK